MNWIQFLEATVGWLANIIQIATAIFALVLVMRTRRKLNRMLTPNPEATQAERQVAIAIGIRGSIRGSVDAYLKKVNTTHMAIFDIFRPAEITKREAYDVLREVNQLKQTLTDRGVDHVFLFYKGPVTLAMGIGALLDNWVPVTAHDFVNGTYVPSIVLGKGSVFDIVEAILNEGEEIIVDRIAET